MYHFVKESFHFMIPARDIVICPHSSGHSSRVIRPRASTGAGRPMAETPVRAGRMRPPGSDQGKELRPMTTRVTMFESDAFGVVQAMLVVLLTIWAILGIVAAVATL